MLTFLSFLKITYKIKGKIIRFYDLPVGRIEGCNLKGKIYNIKYKSSFFIHILRVY